MLQASFETLCALDQAELQDYEAALSAQLAAVQSALCRKQYELDFEESAEDLVTRHLSQPQALHKTKSHGVLRSPLESDFTPRFSSGKHILL